MSIQQFIANFRATLRQELNESTYFVNSELLYLIDSCLLNAYLKEVSYNDIIIDD